MDHNDNLVMIFIIFKDLFLVYVVKFLIFSFQSNNFFKISD